VDKNQNRVRYARNLVLAATAGQVGCTTVVLVLGALFLGLWLDSLLGVKGPFTIILLVASIPVSLYLVMRMALRAARAIQGPEQQDEDAVSDTSILKED